MLHYFSLTHITWSTHHHPNHLVSPRQIPISRMSLQEASPQQSSPSNTYTPFRISILASKTHRQPSPRTMEPTRYTLFPRVSRPQEQQIETQTRFPGKTGIPAGLSGGAYVESTKSPWCVASDSQSPREERARLNELAWRGGRKRQVRSPTRRARRGWMWGARVRQVSRRVARVGRGRSSLYALYPLSRRAGPGSSLLSLPAVSVSVPVSFDPGFAPLPCARSSGRLEETRERDSIILSSGFCMIRGFWVACAPGEWRRGSERQALIIVGKIVLVRDGLFSGFFRFLFKIENG